MVAGPERDLVARARRAAAEHDRAACRPSASRSPTSGVADAVDAHVADPDAVHEARRRRSPSRSSRLLGAGTCPTPDPNSKSHTMPDRCGLAAASARPARNVKQPTTPSTPTIAPISAERTGTARRPRPGSTARREPIASAGGSPARAVQRPTVDGEWRTVRRPLTAQSGRDDRDRENGDEDRRNRQTEDEPVGVIADVEVEAARLADREALRQADRDARRRRRTPAPR